MKPIISVKNLGKMYRIRSVEKKRYRTLRDDLAETFQNILQGNFLSASRVDDFWALKDIDFDIYPGEVVGVIGRNGAGKSTLLKILSRITPPTKGEAILLGRVGSLLEVGTGFHPELTGRENIYLSGAILGMSRAEIKKKFDEIVEFAEVEKFLDTPVKRYSSGMYVRLAFGVAAHLESEILVVDEVLAVGDAQFQKKCLGKMQDVSNAGRTVLFVSHSMPIITSLCPKTILLDYGKIAKFGLTSDVVMHYYTSGEDSPAASYYLKQGRKIGDEYAILVSGFVENIYGEIKAELDINERFTICMVYRILSLNNKFKFIPNFHIHNREGILAFVTYPEEGSVLKPGEYLAKCSIPANFLNDGAYFVGLALSSFDAGSTVHFYEQSALLFNIKDPIEGTPERNSYIGSIPGVVRPKLEWSVGEAL